MKNIFLISQFLAIVQNFNIDDLNNYNFEDDLISKVPDIRNYKINKDSKYINQSFKEVDEDKVKNESNNLSHIQYTIKNRVCWSTCEIDIMYPDQEFCQVKIEGKDEKQQCISKFNLSILRTKLNKKRELDLNFFIKSNSDLSKIIKDFKSVSNHEDNIINLRIQNQNNMDKENKSMYELQSSISQLNGNIYDLQVNKNKIEDFRSLIRDYIKNSSKAPADCNGISGYELRDVGTGLNVTQYNNLNWDGQGITHINSEINQQLINEAPIPGLDPNNFSIKILGFIKPPETSEYTFYCISDDGCIIKINNRDVLVDRLPLTTSNTLMQPHYDLLNQQKYENKVKEFFDLKSLNDGEPLPVNTKSESVYLSTEQHSKIEVQYKHTIHDSKEDDQIAFLKLQWESTNIKKTVIQPSQLFPSIDNNRIVISEQDPVLFHEESLIENDQAFVDSETWVVKQIPPELMGMTALKFIKDFAGNSIKFTVNARVKVQIAIDSTLENNYLRAEFKDSGYDISFLKLSVEDTQKLANFDKVQAMADMNLRLQYLEFEPGIVEILFNINRLKHQQINTMAIVSPVSPLAKFSCSGEMTNLSDPQQEYYSSCQSLIEEEENDCKNAFMLDQYWMPLKAPASLKIEFKMPVIPYKIVFLANPDTGLYSKKINIYQKDDFMEEIILIANTQTYQLLNEVRVWSLVLEVDQDKPGAQFEVWGLPCTERIIKPTTDIGLIRNWFGFRKEIPQVQYGCEDKLDANVEENSILTCNPSCLNASIKNENVIQFDEKRGMFAKDSSVCMAAIKHQKDHIESRQIDNLSFGLVKKYDPTDVQNFFITFDAKLLLRTFNFTKNEEVDVLDGRKCYQRAFVQDITGDKPTDTASVVLLDQELKYVLQKMKLKDEKKAESLERSIQLQDIQKCGEKVGKPCVTNPMRKIKVKFCPEAKLKICKQQLERGGEEVFWDTGDVPRRHDKYNFITQGWQPTNMLPIFNPKTLKEEFITKEKIFLNSGMLMNTKSHGQWVIKVSNGKQSVKLKLGYIPSEAMDENNWNKEFVGMVNKVQFKGQLSSTSQAYDVIIDGLEVKNEELRIKQIEGNILLLSAELQPKVEEKPKKMKSVSSLSNTITQINCSYDEDPLNCAFFVHEMNFVSCDGSQTFIKVLWNDKDKETACKQKCVLKEYSDTFTRKAKEECELYCPQSCVPKQTNKYQCVETQFKKKFQ